MPLSCPIDDRNGNHELVICDSEFSRQAHKELFRFGDDSYLTADDSSKAFTAVADVVDSCNSASPKCPSRIHVVLAWENLLRISLWKPGRPTAGDAFTLLKNNGLNSQDLQPFKTADINDLFPWLYYGRRFDILKKVCRATKKQVESRLKDTAVRVDCHLVAEEAKRIVASSL